MDPLTMMAIGAGTGLVKSELFDRPAEQRQRRAQAELTRYSPWTGMKGDLSRVKEADPLGSAMQYGAVGGQMGMGLEAQAQNKELLSKLAPWGQMRAPVIPVQTQAAGPSLGNFTYPQPSFDYP